MAKNQIIELSTTAALNTDVGGISIDEGVFPDKVNDGMRYMTKIMADSVTRHVVKTVGSYTPVKTDHNQFWRCTGAVTLNLTAAATLTDGWCLWVRANGGAVTIDPSGAELIDGAATLVIPDGASCLIVCTGTAFFSEFNTGVLSPAFALKQDGRLTLETGVPVSTTDQLAKGTIYYAPYVGNVISLYSGTNWVQRTFAEISLALTATSGKPYDVFVYDNVGVATLETLVWTDDTNRATALVRQDGVLCKTGALTRRYVGTFYASAANQCEDSKAKRFVWNMYNRVSRVARPVDEATASWNYTTATIRQANANTANQFDFVRGLDENVVEAVLSGVMSLNSTANIRSHAGIGLDSTTAFAGDSTTGAVANAAGSIGEHVARFTGHTGIGKHSLMWNEFSIATGTCTWFGTASPIRPGLVGIVIA